MLEQINDEQRVNDVLGSLSRTHVPELLNPGAGFQEFDHRDFAMAFKRVDKETLPPRRWALKGRYGDGKSTFILALRQPALIVDADGRRHELKGGELYELSEEPAVLVQAGEEIVEPLATLDVCGGVGQDAEVAGAMADFFREAAEVLGGVVPGDEEGRLEP